MIKFYFKRCLFIVLFFLSDIFADNNKILVLSIPKCGTCLAAKCVRLLTDKKLRWLWGISGKKRVEMRNFGLIKKNIDALSEDQFIYAHLPCFDGLKRLITSGNYKIIFIYRDPRSQLASYARWKRDKHPEECIAAGIDANDLDRIIEFLIRDGHFYKKYKNNINGINDFYHSFMPWAGCSNFFVVRFEDLVGFKGGGSSQKQYQVVMEMAKYLGLNKSEEEIKSICEQLFGGTLTFNEGQISGWEKYLNAKNKRLFKKYTGSLLVDLDYEKDENW